ncbi:putative cytokinetic ring protein SteA [Flaviflexus massiliensis]|uniref:putative cytokinetic ring protein SteA n=1 Tax=Flaviflexus massiliensis TaxID=1522309 RepID=UPI0006D5B548|nr:putative cytokinetic ring protein SteA [Flaviflexus massiliensis]
MKWNLRRRGKPTEPDQLGGYAKVDSRTKRLTKRLTVGEVAIIDHEDIDRVSAEALVACEPVAVLNAAKSTSGRYPNMGPGILLAAGIPLIDDLGSQIMDVAEGTSIHIEEDGSVYRGSELVAEGVWQTSDLNELAMEEARAGVSTQLSAFAHNTMEYLEREHDLILNSVGIPDVRTEFDDRQVLIVVRGYHYKDDLNSLRAYIRDYRPILVGVDGGADAMLELGLVPDVIVGDMDSVSDRALACGAEVIVHAYRDGRAPGVKRVEELGVPYVVFPMTGTSEDAAMILADSKGAKIIVAVGTHSSLVEFLDKGREGMASTFLTRLKVGGRLIDAKGASQLYQSRISSWQLVALVLAGVFAMIAAITTTDVGQALWSLVQAWFSDVWNNITGIFG